jgi:hypothetical protein
MSKSFEKDVKFLSCPVIYQGRGLYIDGGKTFKPIAIDVKNFIQANDFFLGRIAKEEGIWDLPDNDSKALACLSFVRKHVKYVGDKEQVGLNEFWMFPNETLALGKCDCEDGAILLVTLARTAGIPAANLRVCAGWVVAGANAPLGGHAYAIYRASDGDWKVLDWCYHPNSLPILKRLPFNKEPLYKDVWFSFNDKGSWSKNTVPTTIIKSCKNTKV